VLSFRKIKQALGSFSAHQKVSTLLPHEFIHDSVHRLSSFVISLYRLCRATVTLVVSKYWKEILDLQALAEPGTKSMLFKKASVTPILRL
jgi:hypothetical protein